MRRANDITRKKMDVVINKLHGCCQLVQGKVSLISINALHQLHIFIFFLAVFHVTYSAITMALGRAKAKLSSSSSSSSFMAIPANNFEPRSWRRCCRFVDGKSGKKKPRAKISSSLMVHIYTYIRLDMLHFFVISSPSED